MNKIFSWMIKIACGASLLALAACGVAPSTGGQPTTAVQPSPAPSDTAEALPTSTVSSPPMIGITVIPAGTVESSGPVATLPPGATQEPGPTSAPGEPAPITLADQGKTIHLKVGQRVLLNLGMDVYSWTVSVAHQEVLSRVIGITVIRGAQGVYEAKAPGTTTLQAAGDPLCRQSKPACGIPNILFQVTVVVE